MSLQQANWFTSLCVTSPEKEFCLQYRRTCVDIHSRRKDGEISKFFNFYIFSFSLKYAKTDLCFDYIPQLLLGLPWRTWLSFHTDYSPPRLIVEITLLCLPLMISKYSQYGWKWWIKSYLYDNYIRGNAINTWEPGASPVYVCAVHSTPISISFVSQMKFIF